MEQTSGHGAYRCLPLLIANQAGWFVLCPTGLRAQWDGRPEADDARGAYRRCGSASGSGSDTALAAGAGLGRRYVPHPKTLSSRTAPLRPVCSRYRELPVPLTFLPGGRDEPPDLPRDHPRS